MPRAAARRATCQWAASRAAGPQPRSHIATGIQSDAISDAVYDLLGFQPPAHNKPTTGFHAALTFAFECRSVRLYGFEGAMTSDGHMLNLADHNVLTEHKLLARLSNRSLHVPIGNRSRLASGASGCACCLLIIYGRFIHLFYYFTESITKAVHIHLFQLYRNPCVVR